MIEPKYDEDVVNLGYLNKILNNDTKVATSITISRHFASKPNPPYYAGDTWQDGNVLYTCVNTRLIGFYSEIDWVTESGAKKEAELKNRIFISYPSNYSIGDMWILQSDNDHKAGKKGEILISTGTSKEYTEDDWINNLSYGNVTSAELNKKTNEIEVNLENKFNNEIQRLEEEFKTKLNEFATQLDNKVPSSNLQIGSTVVSEYILDEETGMYYKDVVFPISFTLIPTVFIQLKSDSLDIENIVTKVGNVTINGFTIFLDIQKERLFY